MQDLQNDIELKANLYKIYKYLVIRLNEAHKNNDIKKLYSVLGDDNILSLLGADMFSCLHSHYSLLFKDLIDKREKETKTYIVLDTNNGYYKIGKTTQKVKDRIQQWSSLACAELGRPIIINKDVEKELHKKFKDKRIKGEWFNLTREDIIYIEILSMYPFLDYGKINNILEYYTTKRHKDSIYYVKNEIEDCMNSFFKDCKYRISNTKASVIATHDCLLNSKCVISKEYAVDYLGFVEEEFE